MVLICVHVLPSGERSIKYPVSVATSFQERLICDVETAVAVIPVGAAGAVFFGAYCGALLRDRQRGLLRRLIVILVGFAAAAGILRILLLAGSMSGEPAGMFDSSFAGMILRAGEGRASGVRIDCGPCGAGALIVRLQSRKR